MLECPFKDPKVEILAGIAARDNIYQNNVDHIENQDSLNIIHKCSELKQLASEWERSSAPPSLTEPGTHSLISDISTVFLKITKHFTVR